MNSQMIKTVMVVSLLMCTVSMAEVDRSKVPDASSTSVWTPPNVSVWQLGNGLSVWHVEQRHTPLVTFSLVLPQGAETEPAKSAGRLSLMVDLMDEGAGSRNALEVSAEMQRLAMDLSGSVQTDSTVFSMNILAEKLTESLSVFTDILLRPTFDGADFERRKAQRIASALSSEADLGQSAFRVLARSLFESGYRGMPSSGTKSTIEGITLDGVRQVYPEIIKPDGGVIIVVGAVDEATLKASLNGSGLADWLAPAAGGSNMKTPGDVPASQARAVAPVSTAKPSVQVVDFPGSAQTFVIMGQRTAGVQAEDRYNAQVFNHGFSGSFTSRVNLNLREDKGYTYGARGGFSRSRLAGQFAIYAKVKRDTTRASLDELFLELNRVSTQTPVSQVERDNAVNGLLKGFPGQFERGGALAGKLVSLARTGRLPNDLMTWPAKIKSVTLEAARIAAKQYTDPADFTVVIAGDWAKVKASLDGLGRTVVVRNADGTVIEAPKQAPSTKK
jgi:zinc protease